MGTFGGRLGLCLAVRSRSGARNTGPRSTVSLAGFLHMHCGLCVYGCRSSFRFFVCCVCFVFRCHACVNSLVLCVCLWDSDWALFGCEKP